MKNKSKSDIIFETSNVIGKWGVLSLVLGIVIASIGIIAGAAQIVCGAMLMKKKKELSDAA